MKKGFTLVELSIVLVIIGLLIGGILVAQSMIQTVRAQRVISNLEKYGIAISNFKTTYKQIPGDSSFFVPAGNNDNVSNGVVGGCSGAYSTTEAYNSWGHLSAAKMLDKTYASYSPTRCPGGVHNDTFTADANAELVAPFTTDHNDKFIQMRGQSKYPIIIEKPNSFPMDLPIGMSVILEPKIFMAVTAKVNARNNDTEANGYSVGYPIGQCLLGAPTFGIGDCTHPDAVDGVLIYKPIIP